MSKDKQSAAFRYRSVQELLHRDAEDLVSKAGAVERTKEECASEMAQKSFRRVLESF